MLFNQVWYGILLSMVLISALGYILETSFLVQSNIQMDHDGKRKKTIFFRPIWLLRIYVDEGDQTFFFFFLMYKTSTLYFYCVLYTLYSVL